jgi:hypothetical protein
MPRRIPLVDACELAGYDLADAVPKIIGSNPEESELREHGFNRTRFSVAQEKAAGQVKLLASGLVDAGFAKYLAAKEAYGIVRNNGPNSRETRKRISFIQRLKRDFGLSTFMSPIVRAGDLSGVEFLSPVQQTALDSVYELAIGAYPELAVPKAYRAFKGVVRDLDRTTVLEDFSHIRRMEVGEAMLKSEGIYARMKDVRAYDLQCSILKAGGYVRASSFAPLKRLRRRAESLGTDGVRQVLESREDAQKIESILGYNPSATLLSPKLQENVRRYSDALSRRSYHKEYKPPEAFTRI